MTREEKLALVRYHAERLSSFTGSKPFLADDEQALEVGQRIVTLLNELIEERAAA